MALSFSITLLVAFLGGYIANKLKMPAGFMVGSMILVGIFNVITGITYVAVESRFLVQVIAGGFIGMSMDKEKFVQLKTMVKPAIVMMIGLLFLNISVGFFIYKTTSLDLLSSLFAAVPGGMSDMSIISSEMGADTSSVAIFQLARLVGVISIFPMLIKQVHKKIGYNEEKNCGDNVMSPSSSSKTNSINDKKEIIQTLIIAFVFGILGKIIRIPAGTMIFSLLGVAIFKVWKNKGYMPLSLKKGAQSLAGAFIGCGITKDLVYNLKSFIIPVIIMIFMYIILCALLGILLSKLFNIDIVTSMFCCTPAGASDMALIATDLGANGADIALLQIIRLITVIVLFPSVIKVIISI